jgi:hydroxyacylglutathione hydrolase
MRSVSQLLKKGIKLVPKQVPILSMAPMSSIQPLTFKFNYNVCQVKSQSQNLFKSSYEGEGFYVEQMLVGCLAIYSYYVESNGEAFIIDPQNDISKYNEIMKDRKAKLKGVFLTHYHADYVAGHG